MDTARRYPRTLRDAFKGPDYACAVEHHKTQAHEWALYIVAVVALIVILVFVMLGG